MLTRRLRELLAAPGLLQIPGCYDGLSARLVARAGFPVAYMTGFGTAASRLGAPDTGLISFAEMAGHAAALAGAIDIPLIADADTGYGGPANVRRTVRTYAQAGVAGIQIEDQEWPKRCGHTPGRRVVDEAEAVARVRAAVDAARESGMVVVARTDARDVLGLDVAIGRGRAFREAGADVVFVEAPASREEIRRVVDEIPAPVLVNLIEDGRTPVLAPEELARIGVKIALYPLTLLAVAADAMRTHLGGGAPFLPHQRSLSFSELRDIVGFDEHDELDARYRSVSRTDPATGCGGSATGP